MSKIEKAILEYEYDRYVYSCDRCGYSGPMEQFYSFIYNKLGERLDLCERCLDKDDWGERY